MEFPPESILELLSLFITSWKDHYCSPYWNKYHFLADESQVYVIFEPWEVDAAMTKWNLSSRI